MARGLLALGGAACLAFLLVPGCNDTSHGVSADETSRPPATPPGEGLSDALAIIAGPYLQNVTRTAVTVMWETTLPATSHVDYGPDPSSYGAAVDDPLEVSVHEVRLEGLEPDVPCHYAVRSEANGASISSDAAAFRTAPAATAFFTILAYGDSRSQPAVHRAVASGMLDSLAEISGPAIAIHTGDFVTDGTRYERWRPEFFEPAAALLRSTPLFTCLGNHELDSRWYYTFFSVPADASGSNTEAWYSFDYGCAHITSLDTCREFGPQSGQYLWLENDLRSPPARAAAWRLVFFHHPPYSSGYHGGDPQVQAHLVPLFEAYGVDLVLSGHDHLYERSRKDGITYIVTGGGGAPIYPVDLTLNPYAIYPESALHHCVLTVSPSSIHLEARGTDGEAFDRVTIPAASGETPGIRRR